jgi:hypothetical protein
LGQTRSPGARSTPPNSGGKVVANDGRILTLGKLMKSGGAGSIFRIAEAAELVAKVYHPHVDRAVYERKVEAMLTLVPDLPDLEEHGVREVQMAWPRLLLRDPQGGFLGFAMPLLDFQTSVELECVMQERQARAQGLPTGLGARLTLATNLAGVIAELHRQGHYVVDLKPVNLRFYRRSLHVAMLDCDGCSIQGRGERFRAPQFTPEYLAPELHGWGIALADEETQDRFALAVVVFQLLNFGIHPFTGRPASDRIPTDIPGRIAARCYAYGERGNPNLAPSPASGHAAIPADLRAMFDRAFEGSGATRPSTGEWVGRLREYGQRSRGKVVACRADPRHQHFAGMPCAACARATLLAQAASATRAAPKGMPGRWSRGGAAYSPPAPVGVSSSIKIGKGGNRSQMLAIAGVLTAILVFAWMGGAKDCSPVGPPRSLSGPSSTTPGASPSAVAAVDLAQYRTTMLTKRFDEVLLAAQAASGDAILEQLHRLPGSSWDGTDEKECRAALSAWQGKTRWIPDDPFFAEDRSLQARWKPRPRSDEAGRPGRGPCEDLYFLMLAVVRVQELCRVVVHSPAVHAGVGQTACREQQVIPAGVDTLRRSVIYGESLNPLVWEHMAQAFLLADDTTSAFRSFVVAALLNRRIGLSRALLFIPLHERWLRQRAEILQASAQSKVMGWYGDAPPAEVAAKMVAAWPEEPPPEEPPAPKPKPARPARAKR